MSHAYQDCYIRILRFLILQVSLLDSQARAQVPTDYAIIVGEQNMFDNVSVVLIY